MKQIPPMIRALLLALLLLPGTLNADDFEFHAPTGPDDKTAAETMRDLAERALPVYQDEDIERYLANLSILQMVAGNYKAAGDSLDSLRERRKTQGAGKPVERPRLLDLYVRARALEAGDKTPFAQAFAQAFREAVPALNDLDAYSLTRTLTLPPEISRTNLQLALDRGRGKERLSMDDALDLAKTWLL
ncbi:MAG TPA: hypothetical protein VG672_04055, partial [Bryobacteraceae bacterium]|nr:hypothetical protein [Bryobacteraceae bacterium]